MKIKTLLCGAALALLLSGCVNMSYNGKTDLAPLAKDARSGIYYDPAHIPVPEKDRLYVGELTASASSASYSASELRAKIVKEAKKHGANAVLVIAVDNVRTGSVRSDQLKNQTSSRVFATDTEADVAQAHDNYFSGYGTVTSIDTYKVTVKAKLYKIPQSAIKAPAPAVVPGKK